MSLQDVPEPATSVDAACFGVQAETVLQAVAKATRSASAARYSTGPSARIPSVATRVLGAGSGCRYRRATGCLVQASEVILPPYFVSAETTVRTWPERSTTRTSPLEICTPQHG